MADGVPDSSEEINTKSPIDQAIMFKTENNDQDDTNQETDDNEGGLEAGKV